MCILYYNYTSYNSNNNKNNNNDNDNNNNLYYNQSIYLATYVYKCQ